MKALVTGASGFIGSHLVEELVRRGWTVRCLVRPTSRLKWIEGVKAEHFTGDVRDKASLLPAVEGVDVVFHLGAIIHARDWETST